ncbi:MAG: class I SAM-dependent methyltransferase [Candidatus Eisenbacteria bacterium]|nr:class I SAM-dependent methyltransferase [Candidatus Eisenbacteria bacterium]
MSTVPGSGTGEWPARLSPAPRRRTAQDLAALARTLCAYAVGGPWPLLRASWRFASAPLARVAAVLPQEGTIVDVGCGQGHFLRYCLETGHQRLIGVELSSRSLTRARVCLPPAVRLVRAAAETLPLRGAACVVVLDVLYLLEPRSQEMFLASAAVALQPGGFLIIKTMEPSRRIRQTLNRLQEWLAVRVLHITLGRDFHFRSSTEWVSLCRRHGMSAYSVPLWRGYVHPHVMIVARRIDGEPTQPQG